MKCFFGQKADNRHRKITLLFLAISCLSLISAFIVGISGNRTGITLCYIAATALILAFTHKWRKMKNFLILSGLSVLGFGVFVVLHNLFYALAELAADIIVLRYVLEFLHAAFFLIALILCPSGLVIGAVGSLFLLCRRLCRPATKR
jgi:hypothetical protein